jgi:hypothetical protein
MQEEMESLLVAVRDIALSKGPEDIVQEAEAKQLESLIARMKVCGVSQQQQQQRVRGDGHRQEDSERRSLKSGVDKAVGSGAAALVERNRAADKYRKEFAVMKAALAADSAKLKQELATAKKMLQDRLQLGGQ